MCSEPAISVNGEDRGIQNETCGGPAPRAESSPVSRLLEGGADDFPVPGQMESQPGPAGSRLPLSSLGPCQGATRQALHGHCGQPASQCPTGTILYRHILSTAPKELSGKDS